MENPIIREVSFDEYLKVKNQGGQLVVALFYAPNTEKSQWMVEKAKEIVPKSGAFLLLIDGNRYSQDLSRVFVDLFPTLIFYKKGQEICRIIGKTTEKIFGGVLEAHA